MSGCEVSVVQNADGTYAVKIRVPFATGVDPATLATIRMVASGLNLTNISYSYVDANGVATPITEQSARGAVKAPYLEISGTAANMDAIKNGAITAIRYTLKNDAKDYVQTVTGGGLKIASLPGYPTTPAPSPSTGGGSSSGCATGTMGLAALAGCFTVTRRIRK